METPACCIQFRIADSIMVNKDQKSDGLVLVGIVFIDPAFLEQYPIAALLAFDRGVAHLQSGVSSALYMLSA